MLLEITVVAGPRGPGRPGVRGPNGAGTGSTAAIPLLPTEISVTWPVGAAPSGHSLDRALARRWAGHGFTVAGELLASLHPGTPPLVNGAVVVAWPDGPAPAPGGRPPGGAGTVAAAGAGAEAVAAGTVVRTGLVLAVCSGPGAGAVFALQRGTYTLGRGQCRLRIADPALSRHHGTLVVGSHSITLSAAPGSSGFLLQGAGAAAPADRAASAVHVRAVSARASTTLEVGQLLACGASTLELRFQDPAGASSRAGPADGARHTVCPLDAAALEPIEVAHGAGPVRVRGAVVAAGTLPLVLGVVLAAMTGSWMFLGFAAVGAVTVLLPAFGGSARRRALRSAVSDGVREDAARLSKAFPDAATLSISARTGAMQPRTRPPGLALAVRVGTATGPSAVALSPADPAFSPPLVQFRPVCLRLGAVPQRVCGPSAVLRPLVNYILMQLDAAAVPVVVFGPADALPLPARLLPLTALASSVPAALSVLAGALAGGSVDSAGTAVVLMVLNEPLDLQMQDSPGVHVLHFCNAPGPAPTMELRIAGSSAAGIMGGITFVPDGVPAGIFDAHARRRAASAAGIPRQRVSGNSAAAGTKSLFPNSLPTAQLCTSMAVRQQWERTAGAPLQAVPIGRSAAGAVMFDFQHDGPHLLLGGTTGSGKSEFLRTLVGSLALAHSPADVQFMFVDFKGGAGLGVLGRLPHTTSLITDLGGHGMERTLASLRAELHRREAALAAVEAADNDEYRALTRGSHWPAMAHLVMVIDEFRVLVDQHPDTMAELMRIAAVGRSLGIHLVMATQRPQGALNADIRANVTSSICLRVQSVGDSVDVIGSGAAATISVTAPGRAYISRAGGPAEEFQSATLRLPAAEEDGLPSLELAVRRIGRATPGSADCALPGSDVAAVAAMLSRAWREAVTSGSGGRGGAVPATGAARAVVAPELPDVAEPAATGSSGGPSAGPGRPSAGPGGPAYWLGTADVPQKQSLEPLLWQPGVQSHLACFGTVQETSRALAFAGHQVLADSGRAGAHTGALPLLYLMDGDGSLAALASSPWVGAHVAPGQLRTANHLIERLADAARSSAGTLILCISDWSRWVAALRNSPWHAAEDGVGELVRFSPPNMVVAVGGGRELLTATFLAAIPNRIFLGHGSNPESTALWPRLPAFKQVPGRAAVAGPINAFPGLDGDGAPHLAQLGVPPQTRPPLSPGAGAGSGAAQTLVVREIPRFLPLAQLLAAVEGPAAPANGSGRAARVLLGLGGDGCDPVALTLAPGTVLPVIGGPGSGKSSFIRVMARLHHQPGADADSGQGTVCWLDDAAALTPQELAAASRRLAAGTSIVAAFPYPGPALGMLPLEWGLRTAQQGIVLMPQRAGDAELFGVRLDTMGAEPPGRAVLLERGRRRWFQFPAEPEPGRAG